jgi:hypothetical protein
VDFTLHTSSASLFAAEFTVFDCSLLFVTSAKNVCFREKYEIYSRRFKRLVKYMTVSNKNERINGAENRRTSVK